jgi:hypothetical protein
MNFVQNITANRSSSDSNDANFLLVSIDACSKEKPKFFCHFASFLILIGYLLHLSVFPTIFFKMKKLSSEFAKSYNLSFLWLCTILLINIIDLLEFIIIGDKRVFSILIVFIICFNVLFCLLTIIEYMRNYATEGTFYRNCLATIFSVCLFLIILFARLWSNKNLINFSRKYKISTSSSESSLMFYVINTHFFLYYFVYGLFGTVQIFQNSRNEFVKCFNDLAYMNWLIGSCLQLYYSSILPYEPTYDYIHYKNYFFITTILIIILQDVYLKKYKTSFKLENTTKNIRMKEFDKTGNKFISDDYQSINNIFNESVQNKDEEEDVLFDLHQFNKNKQNQNVVNNNLFVLSNTYEENYNSFKPRTATINKNQSVFETFKRNNKSKLSLLGIFLIVFLIIFTTIVLFNSVTMSYFLVITPLLHPFAIIFSMILKRYSCSYFQA